MGVTGVRVMPEREAAVTCRRRSVRRAVAVLFPHAQEPRASEAYAGLIMFSEPTPVARNGIRTAPPDVDRQTATGFAQTECA